MYTETPIFALRAKISNITPWIARRTDVLIQGGSYGEPIGAFGQRRRPERLACHGRRRGRRSRRPAAARAAEHFAAVSEELHGRRRTLRVSQGRISAAACTLSRASAAASGPAAAATGRAASAAGAAAGAVACRLGAVFAVEGEEGARVVGAKPVVGHGSQVVRHLVRDEKGGGLASGSGTMGQMRESEFVCERVRAVSGSRCKQKTNESPQPPGR